MDIDNCGLCKYAEVYYAYLTKYAKERNTKDIVLNVSAYRDLISNDTVSKVVPCSQIMSEVVDFISNRIRHSQKYH